MIYLTFTVFDYMFPRTCRASRREISVNEVERKLIDIKVFANKSYRPTINLINKKFDWDLTIPIVEHSLSLKGGDSVIVASVTWNKPAIWLVEPSPESIDVKFGEWCVYERKMSIKQ